MTLDDIKKIIESCLNDVVFIYNGKQSGVTSTVNNYSPVFQSWHGDETKEYDSIDDVLNDKFYSGKSIADICEDITFSVV